MPPSHQPPQQSGHNPGQRPEQPEGHEANSTSSQELRPPKIGRPNGLAPNLREAPEDVRLGVRAWLAVSGLQIVYAIVQFISNLVDDSALRQAQREAMNGQGGMFSPVMPEGVSPDSYIMAANVLSSVLLIIAAVACGFLTIRAGRGAVYSRMFLNAGSIYMILSTVLLVFGGSNNSAPTAFVLILGIIQIFSGVAAALGMWFMSRPGNREWFGIPSNEEMEKFVAKLQRAKEEEKRTKKKDSEGTPDGKIGKKGSAGKKEDSRDNRWGRR